MLICNWQACDVVKILYLNTQWSKTLISSEEIRHCPSAYVTLTNVVPILQQTSEKKGG